MPCLGQDVLYCSDSTLCACRIRTQIDLQLGLQQQRKRRPLAATASSPPADEHVMRFLTSQAAVREAQAAE